MKKPSCDKCVLLVFPDGTYFHELKCPNNSINKTKAKEAKSND